MVIAPPSVAGGRWLRLFGESGVAMASGWMTLRGIRRRRGFEKGFVISDHADFPGLLAAIEASGAGRVLVTHGAAEPLARLLRERGLDAAALRTRFTGESAPEAGDDDGGLDGTEDGELVGAEDDGREDSGNPDPADAVVEPRVEPA